MPRFRVTFRKTVYDATGHAHDICQRIVEVEAGDCGSARDAAIACFCDRERITHWLNHADRMEIALAEQSLADRAVVDGRTRRAA